MSTLPKPRRTVVVNQAMADGTTFHLNLAHHVGFAARYLILRQLIYSNVAGNDNGIYLLSADMSPPGNIAAVYIGIQGQSITSECIFTLAPYRQSIAFTISPANVAFPAPSGHLTMVLEFVSDL